MSLLRVICGLILICFSVAIVSHSSWPTIRIYDSLSARSAMNSHGSSSSNNVRQDISRILLKALQDKEFKLFDQQVKKAMESELDYFIFMATLNQLIKENPSLLGKLKEKLQNGLDRESPFRLRNLFQRRSSDFLVDRIEGESDSLYWYLSMIFLWKDAREILQHSQFSTDARLYYYDLDGSVHRIPADRGPNDFTQSFLYQVIEEWLFQADGLFLLASIKDSFADDSEVTLNDIEYPIKVIKFQGGIIQDVFLILVTLKDERVVPFTLLVAKSFGYSNLVREEFVNLYRHRGNPYVVRVFRYGFVVKDNGIVSAYSSEFLNNYGEMIYNPKRQPHELGKNPGRFRLSSNHPLRVRDIVDSNSPHILASIVKTIVHFYDPSRETMIDMFTVQAGDVNFDESSSLKLKGLMMMIPLEKIRVKLIAWRGTKEGVDIPHFVEYLFKLSYLHRDRDEIVTEGLFTDLITIGVLAGLRLGLIERYGLSQGLQETRRWLELYMAEVRKGALMENPLFTIERIERYITNAIEPHLLSSHELTPVESAL